MAEKIPKKKKPTENKFTQEKRPRKNIYKLYNNVINLFFIKFSLVKLN